MISFFHKKTYLVDLLEGFVDIHNHILPGIDDGAQSIEESIALINGLSEFGVKNFICTPHIMHNFHDNTPKTIENSYNNLKSALGTQNINEVKIDVGAEHMIDDNFEAILEKSQIMPLRHKYLLVEMSFLQPPIHLNETLDKIKKKEYFPILAHPERYHFLHNQLEKYNEIKNRGVLFQVNLLSLGDYYGGEVQKVAYQLIDGNLVDFFGSDVHNLRHINHLKEIRITDKKKELLRPIIERTVNNFD